MATYYIDYDAGADTNNGTTTGTPFKHCPGDDNATDTADSTTLAAGDVVVFKGGVTYEGQIDGDWSGSVGSVITYISGQNAPYSWGTGQAIVDGTGLTVSAGEGGFNLGGASYITIDGMKVTGVPDSTPSAGYSGGIAINLGHHIIIQNCNLEYNGKNGVVMYGIWDTGSRSDGLTVTDSVLAHNAGHGILIIRGVENILIEDNDIYDNGYPAGAGQSDGIFMGGTGQGANMVSDVIIRGNTIYDNVGKGPLIFSGINVLVEDNYFYSTTQEQIGVSIGCGSNEEKSSNITIRNNVIDIDAYMAQGAIKIQESWAGGLGIDGVYIYNNYLRNRGRYYIIVVDQDTALLNIIVKNNVIDGNGLTATNYLIRLEDDGAVAAYTSDYNHYWDTGGNDSEDRFYYGSAAGYTLTEWKAAGKDTFTHTHWTDPLVGGTFVPLITSPLIDTGVDLSGTGFSDDKLGTLRPIGVGWDIGACEYAGGDPPDAPFLKDLVLVLK